MQCIKKQKIMSIEWDVKFSDSLLVCLAILARNILKNKTLCVVSPRVNFSDSPQYTSSSPAHHARAGTRALVVHGLYAVAPAHLALGLVRLSLVGMCLIIPVVRGSIRPAEQGCQTGEKAVTFGSDGDD